MLTVQCPHCSAALKLREAPAAGKVKCPKCSKVVPVKAGSAAKGSPKPRAAAPAGKPVDPDDDAFDFGRINFPAASGATAVSQFPVTGGATLYEGPIPGDPLEMEVAEEESDGEAEESLPPVPGAPQVRAAAPTEGAETDKKKKPWLLIGVIGGLAVLLIGGGIAFAMLSGGGDESAAPEGEVAAEASEPEA